mmetsp:Transcript_54988/g.152457  ORF Transcript_54988/g.152457 Transcript_54988/m.152457 type:complete len:252 (-) Transcript_54988:94-849(-)
MADSHAAEEDPFAEYLSQEQTAGAQAPVYAQGQASPQVDANMALLQLVESAQRQEQLLGKVCGLLAGLDDKIGRLAASQERLESSMQQLASQGAGLAGGTGGAGSGAPRPAPPQRGSLVQPPGKSGPVGGATAGSSFSAGGAAAAAGPSPEEQRLVAERLAADRARAEEEARRREEELARRREEEDRRRREEEERRRVEEERRKEEERQRKASLEKKTGSLMNSLVSGSAGSSLFADDEPKKRSKGGLFDD